MHQLVATDKEADRTLGNVNLRGGVSISSKSSQLPATPCAYMQCAQAQNCNPHYGVIYIHTIYIWGSLQQRASSPCLLLSHNAGQYLTALSQ